MWHRLADVILKFRLPILTLLVSLTIFMGWKAREMQLSYEFTNAIPTDNPKYKTYQDFRKTFGEDGTTLVTGVETKDFFNPSFFRNYTALAYQWQAIPGVENVLSIPTAVALTKDTVSDKLQVKKLFADSAHLAEDLVAFQNLPFYAGQLYNKEDGVYVAALRINKEILASKDRVKVVDAILAAGKAFSAATGTEIHYSGLPYIRTRMAVQVQKEMTLFLVLSFALTAAILWLFFRSFSAVVISMVVVGVGVVWSIATLVFFGYQITLLTALIPPLIVVIGIPNCIYLLNQYHIQYRALGDQKKALRETVARMGVVTLLTNLTAAIGFGVFAATKSAILKEFGLVSGLNIFALFFISLLFIPIFLSYLAPPTARQIKYLDNQGMQALLDRLTRWVFHNRKAIFAVTAVALAVGLFGALRLHSESHIVDDLPKKDPIYTDLKFFETHLKGVMPLEIVVDAKRKNGAVSLPTLQKLDELDVFLRTLPEGGRPLSIVNGVKFARQAYYDGDSTSYGVPNMFDGAFLQPYLRTTKTSDTASGQKAALGDLVRAFVDSNRQRARVSVSIADIGSVRLPTLLEKIKAKTDSLFPEDKYGVTVTGSSVVFLEGSGFITSSLRESIVLALAMIVICILLLVRSLPVTGIAVLVNLAPLLLTAGVMGWAGVPLKPSTVLVFSIALGITVDVTIRFLVSYRRERKILSAADAVTATMHETGLSIIYTSLVLAAGFGVFAISQFDGTRSLGLLTGGTLLLAMAANLLLQPALLVALAKRKKRD